MNGQTYIVGRITIDKAFAHRQLYETASWFTDYEIPPGTYDVRMHAYLRHGDTAPALRGETFNVWFVAPGKVTASHFVNRLFNAFSVENDRDLDEVRDVSVKVALTDPRVMLTDGALLDSPDHYAPRVDYKVAPVAPRR